MTEHIATLHSGAPFELLDCGVISGVTYHHLLQAGLEVDYTGIDIGEAAIADCRERHPEARWRQMSVTDLAFSDNSFDVVNCRHLLECLPYYETAVREMFRVARRTVVICMFQVREPEALLRRETANGYIWFNRYAPGPFEALLHSLSESVEIVDVPFDHRPNRVYFCTKRSA
ncbi:class I SAM-dependent methyltransferase [Catellatospora tritici]|uniref:class I SAM-dependent methyltransferase n=1 Tax=Catellatospora tritici TaxID=2851566 RepID=UPI001C2CEB71|nr:class I SAM-dependent methyltransferase [Catellatospora tritici]MBV1855876.1 class I SAM-dependent methyltransferase [Catellatospora tritici]